MLSWVGNVGKSVVSQKLRSLGEILSLGVKILLKLSLLLPQFFLCLRPVGVARVHYVNHKVDLEVELQLLADKVCFFQLFWQQFLPNLEKLLLVALVKRLRHFVQ